MNQDQLTDKINKLENNVAELKGMIQQLLLDKWNTPYQNIEDMCVDGKVHDYPSTWHGVTPPCCKKCGKQAKTFEITYSNANAAGWNFENFGGNIIRGGNYYCNSTYSINEDTD